MVKLNTEKLRAVVTAYKVGAPDSVVVVIPKSVREALQIPIGAKLSVKTDAQGRIIYEVIREPRAEEELEGKTKEERQNHEG